MSTTGTPLNLTLAASGYKGWADEMNANLTAINSLIGTINNQIAALQSSSSTVGPKGDVGMQYAGSWNSSTAYVIDDVVTYNGSSYIAIAGNTNAEPDLNTNTWDPLALGGAAGPPGPTGPTGAPGSGTGTSVTFPITLIEGGTGVAAANPAAARTALVAAASGLNGDITGLLALTPPAGLSNGSGGTNTPAIQITSVGDAQGILFTDGTHSGGITTSGDAYLQSLSMPGGFVCGTAEISGLLQIGSIGNGVPGQPVVVSNAGGGGVALEINGGLQVDGSTPAVGSGKIGIGATVVGGAEPTTFLGCWVVNVGGVAVKVKYFA